jgi:hypothetical protein
MLDWPVVPNIWPVKIGTNLSRQEVLTLDVGFQLQQREVLSPRRRLLTIAMLPIPRTDFHVPLNPDVHLISTLGKSVRRNLSTPTIDH